MSSRNKLLALSAVVAVAGGAASAANYNFIDAIDGAGGPIDESIWTKFTTGDYAYFTGPSISLTGETDPDGEGGVDPTAAFAYADAGTAGFGVCRNATSSSYVDVAMPGVSNVCQPGSDDSVQSAFDEVLRITSNENNVQIASITVNGNHDGAGLVVGSQVLVNGVTYTVGVGDLTVINQKKYFTIGLNDVLDTGQSITISAIGAPNLYLSSMEASVVPLPASALLLIGGMGGFAALRRVKRKRS